MIYIQAAFCHTSPEGHLPCHAPPHTPKGWWCGNALPHLPHLATPHLFKCGNTAGKWELAHDGAGRSAFIGLKIG
jgi:hypothetical protein